QQRSKHRLRRNKQSRPFRHVSIPPSRIVIGVQFLERLYDAARDELLPRNRNQIPAMPNHDPERRAFRLAFTPSSFVVSSARFTITSNRRPYFDRTALSRSEDPAAPATSPSISGLTISILPTRTLVSLLGVGSITSGRTLSVTWRGIM